MDDKMKRLKELMQGELPLPGEEGFATDDETIARYLKSRDWNLAEAEKMLRATLEYRRKVKPLEMECRYCRENPGYHSIRQVGFDESKRPVIYSNFAQASVHRNTVDDSVMHVTYLFENAKRSMAPGVSTWVIVIDCTGISLPSCNPKLGYEVTQIMSNHYPERLGMVICLNHNPMFQTVWNAIKVFLHKNTVAKMKLVRTKSKYIPVFQKYFSEELTDWLLREIKLNKQSPLSTSQVEFWRKPSPASDHDPRGCPSYVRSCVEKYDKNNSDNIHKPHPNIIDVMNGSIKTEAAQCDSNYSPARAHKKKKDGAKYYEFSDDDLDEDNEPIEIDDEYKIPDDAQQLLATS